jgi:hypothetical protein
LAKRVISGCFAGCLSGGFAGAVPLPDRELKIVLAI